MKTLKFLSMAAIITVGAILASCQKEENAPQNQENPEAVETPADNIVVCTTTVNLAAGATKALTPEGVKTFAESEKMAIFYKNTSGSFVKAVSEPLTVGDITNEGKSASFTFQLANPDKTVNVHYVYPPDMITEDGMMPNPALLVAQDGTLDNVSSNLDLAYGNGPWDGENLPGITLENQLAILAITLKNADGSSDITGTITGMTLSDGEQSCTVTRSAAAGPIYVAIPPISNKDIEITATAGAKAYIKSLSGKTYEAGNGYNVSWRMETNLTAVSGHCTIDNGETLTGTLGGNYKVSIADGATVVLKNANISYSSNGADYAGLTLLGDGTLVLADGTNNTAIGGLDGDGYSNWPGIFVPAGKTLTINGNTGVLNAARGGNDTTNGSPAGIGASWKNPCGNIIINGGVINATGGAKSAGIGGAFTRTCGDITINGGTITAIGHAWGSGIGLGAPVAKSVTSISGCNITITGGTVTATGGVGGSEEQPGGAGIGTGYARNTNNNQTTNTITLGNICISGGTVIATGGVGAAAIGTSGTSGNSINNCGNITITDGVTSVTATKGSGATNSIGKGSGNGTCGTVTIGSVTGAISDSPYTYPVP